MKTQHISLDEIQIERLDDVPLLIGLQPRLGLDTIVLTYAIYAISFEFLFNPTYGLDYLTITIFRIAEKCSVRNR